MFLKMTDLELTHKKVLIRQDLNVPMQAGKITNDTRLVAALPTIRQALEKQASVILLSHLGRPQEGEPQAEFSLAPVAAALSKLLSQPVKLITTWQQGIDVNPGEVVLCENVRFNRGEKVNDDKLAKQYANLCDVFVMDAFATAHRAQASTYGVAKYAPQACAGPLLVAELTALQQALHDPKPPVLAIVGGSKVSTKLNVLQALLKKVDALIVGGGIANTFIAANDHAVGKSLYEPDLITQAKQLMMQAQQNNIELPIPKDVVVGEFFAADTPAAIKAVDQVADHDMIFDIGPQTCEQFAKLIAKANTILWNGPVGVFEFAAFAAGTKAIAQAIAASPAFSIAGGGDTLAAIDQFHIHDKVSYISTGGGAFLTFVEGKPLPAVQILEERARSQTICQD